MAMALDFAAVSSEVLPFLLRFSTGCFVRCRVEPSKDAPKSCLFFFNRLAGIPPPLALLRPAAFLERLGMMERGTKEGLELFVGKWLG